MTFADRKKNRLVRKTKLQESVAESKSGNNYDDARIWSCATNAAGTGSAIIRFLDFTDADHKYFTEVKGIDSEKVPFYVMHRLHAFKGDNGKWFINHCPTDLVGSNCPVCELNSEVVSEFGGWDAVGDEHEGKQLVRRRKRKEVYYANILVIEDKVAPENEGKVMLFKFGKSIHLKIAAQLNPDFEDEEECNIADYWDGKNFKFKIVKKDGYSNYDNSTWAESSKIAKADPMIEKIISMQYPLNEFINDDLYKPYDKLEKELSSTHQRKRSTMSEAVVNDDIKKEDIASTDAPIEANEFFDSILDS